MWIKNKYGEYVNSDAVTMIYYEEDSDTTDVLVSSGSIYEICDGDRTQEILQNIISGTKIMEVK